MVCPYRAIPIILVFGGRVCVCETVVVVVCPQVQSVHCRLCHRHTGWTSVVVDVIGIVLYIVHHRVATIARRFGIYQFQIAFVVVGSGGVVLPPFTPSTVEK